MSNEPSGNFPQNAQKPKLHISRGLQKPYKKQIEKRGQKDMSKLPLKLEL